MDFTLTFIFLGKLREVKGRIHKNDRTGEVVFTSHDNWIEDMPLVQFKDKLDGFEILKLKELGWL